MNQVASCSFDWDKTLYVLLFVVNHALEGVNFCIFKLIAQTSVYGLRTSIVFFLNDRSASISLFCIGYLNQLDYIWIIIELLLYFLVNKYVTVWQKQTCESLY